MTNRTEAITLAELVAPYLRAGWRDHEDPDGMILRTAQFGHALCGSVVAERNDRNWRVYGWTHPHIAQETTPVLRLRVQTVIDLAAPCANRAARCLLAQVLATVLTEELPAGRPWWAQIDLIKIEDIDGLHRALAMQTHCTPRARTLPDLLAELGETRH